MNIDIELIERFHEKWELDEATGCWLWMASLASSGYGQIKIPGTRRQIYAHRLSYLIHHGEIGGGLFVCHACDTPKCVKPSHLFLGTCKDNLQDMKAKGRHLHGPLNGMAKLTYDQARHIHRMAAEGVSQGDLAKSLGIAQSTVWKILHGLRYEEIYREFNAVVE